MVPASFDKISKLLEISRTNSILREEKIEEPPPTKEQIEKQEFQQIQKQLEGDKVGKIWADFVSSLIQAKVSMELFDPWMYYSFFKKKKKKNLGSSIYRKAFQTFAKKWEKSSF